MVILLSISKIELLVSRESNGVLGNYYRISAYEGDTYIGQEIYAGYSKRESEQRARESVRERGGLGLWARR
jgi:hypothetical protein